MLMFIRTYVYHTHLPTSLSCGAISVNQRVVEHSNREYSECTLQSRGRTVTSTMGQHRRLCSLFRLRCASIPGLVCVSLCCLCWWCCCGTLEVCARKRVHVCVDVNMCVDVDVEVDVNVNVDVDADVDVGE
jgi:hypothetical protein